ncbi:MAG: alpha-L-fucosidase, partial [Verrucomicrobia bacterium]|nr:alpha-L-fucosidase [Verrucomicrobiota bacterium]
MMKYCIACLVLGATLAHAADHKEKSIHNAPMNPSSTDADILKLAANIVPSSRQLAYHEEEFIGFIHFGPNTFTGREWGNGMEDPTVFAPRQVDTDQWCEVMKAAGMKKIIVTVKHHDGYCTWQTRYNKDFSVHQSPWENGKGDVLRLLSASCKKYGLRLGVYLSPA